MLPPRYYRGGMVHASQKDCAGLSSLRDSATQAPAAWYSFWRIRTAAGTNRQRLPTMCTGCHARGELLRHLRPSSDRLASGRGG